MGITTRRATHGTVSPLRGAPLRGRRDEGVKGCLMRQG